jgi:hypothetical protein
MEPLPQAVELAKRLPELDRGLLHALEPLGARHGLGCRLAAAATFLRASAAAFSAGLPELERYRWPRCKRNP